MKEMTLRLAMDVIVKNAEVSKLIKKACIMQSSYDTKFLMEGVMGFVVRILVCVSTRLSVNQKFDSAILSFNSEGIKKWEFVCTVKIL